MSATSSEGVDRVLPGVAASVGPKALSVVYSPVEALVDGCASTVCMVQVCVQCEFKFARNFTHSARNMKKMNVKKTRVCI
jgi:hypothetical protein